MARNTKSASARAASEFGTTDWESEFENNPQSPRSADRDFTRDQAHEELGRRIARGELRPLNGREEIKSDWMTDDPVWREFNGPAPAGPTFAERLELNREYSQQIENIFSSPGSQVRPEPEKPVTVEGRPVTGAEYAELLWTEFRQAFPDQAKDANAVERAAKKIISAGGLNPDDRTGFYHRVARELGRG